MSLQCPLTTDIVGKSFGPIFYLFSFLRMGPATHLSLFIPLFSLNTHTLPQTSSSNLTCLSPQRRACSLQFLRTLHLSYCLKNNCARLSQDSHVSCWKDLTLDTFCWTNFTRFVGLVLPVAFIFSLSPFWLFMSKFL